MNQRRVCWTQGENLKVWETWGLGDCVWGFLPIRRHPEQEQRAQRERTESARSSRAKRLFYFVDTAHKRLLKKWITSFMNGI
jgi:hypothetical protein